MADEIIPISEWVHLLHQAISSTMMPSMQAETFTCEQTGLVSDPERLAAFVALSRNNESIQVGFSGSRKAVSSLVAQMFGFEDMSSEDTDISELLDGLAEIINIVAGALHRSLSSETVQLQLSIPLLIHGEVIIQEKDEWVAQRLHIGEDAIDAIIIRGQIQKPGKQR